MNNGDFLFCITGNFNMSWVLYILMIQNIASAEGGRRVSKTLADKAISQPKPQVSPMFEIENFADPAMSTRQRHCLRPIITQNEKAPTTCKQAIKLTNFI